MSVEFVTGTEFILANDAVAIFVTNTDQLPATTRIQVYENAVVARLCSSIAAFSMWRRRAPLPQASHS